MANPDIELTREGVKFSYRTFLSDIATGYTIILIAIFSWYYPIFGLPLQDIFQIHLSTEVKYFLLLLILLLSIPLGLAFNAFSWFCIGFLQVKFEKFWYNGIMKNKILNKIQSILIDTTKDTLFFGKCKEFYGITDEKKFYLVSQIIEDILLIYYPDIIESIRYKQGIQIYLRNSSVILITYVLFYFIASIILFLSFIFKNEAFNINYFSICTIIIIFGLITFSIITMSLISFFYDLEILLIGYLLCRRIEKIEDLKGYCEKICDFLIKTSDASATTAWKRPQIQDIS